MSGLTRSSYGSGSVMQKRDAHDTSAFTAKHMGIFPKFIIIRVPVLRFPSDENTVPMPISLIFGAVI